MSAPQSPIVMFPNACPCCGHATLGGRGEYDICNVCWWEDDGQDTHNANVVRGGPNGKLSLTRARFNFIMDGIFCPSRTDLRDKQVSPDSYPRLRNFTYDLTTKTFFDHDQDWSTSLFELDDDPNSSRFNVGDLVLYRRLDLDSQTQLGTIDEIEWNVNIEVWHYRLLDQLGNQIGKWFDGARLEPQIVG
jgi:hypothetical protein